MRLRQAVYFPYFFKVIVSRTTVKELGKILSVIINVLLCKRFNYEWVTLSPVVLGSATKRNVKNIFVE